MRPHTASWLYLVITMVISGYIIKLWFYYGYNHDLLLACWFYVMVISGYIIKLWFYYGYNHDLF